MADGGIEIGDHTHISRRVVIYSSDHDFRRGDLLPYGPHRTKAPVAIGRNVWVGMNAMILPGVTIGDGAIVAMGAIVTRDVPAFAIVAQPASRIIGERDADTYRALDAAHAYGGRSGWPPRAEEQAAWPKCGRDAQPDLVFVTGTSDEALASAVEPLAGADTAVKVGLRPQVSAWAEAFAAGTLSREALIDHLARLYGTSIVYRAPRFVEAAEGLGVLAEPLMTAVPFARMVCVGSPLIPRLNNSGDILPKVVIISASSSPEDIRAAL